MIEDTKPYLFVAIGGFAGACMRYLINLLVPSMPGILIINVSGCILLGFLLYESQYSGMFSPATRTFLGVGFIGAFTTFSTFSIETLQATPEIAIINVLANVVLGLTGVMIGRQAALRFARGP